MHHLLALAPLILVSCTASLAADSGAAACLTFRRSDCFAEGGYAVGSGSTTCRNGLLH